VKAALPTTGYNTALPCHSSKKGFLLVVLTSLFPAVVQLDTLAVTEETIHLVLRSADSEATCPSCGQLSRAIHSRYSRTLADLPWAGLPVRVTLHTRKFFCRNPRCQRSIFTERLPQLVHPYARRTERLREAQQQLGMQLGGEAGARTAHKQGLPTSPDTLLRLVRQAPSSEPPTPRVVGVDDWALCKGQVYGTILVDLEQHQPIDLLPDRQAETLAAWLQAHPGVEIISRDRAADYAEGATRGAPSALQVADRFHLLQNLREAVQRFLEKNQAALRAAAAPAASAVAPEALATLDVEPLSDALAEPPLTEQEPRTQAERLKQARRERRLARYSDVRALHAQGVSIHEIARRLDMSRQTVRSFLRADHFPEQGERRSRPSKLDPHLPYLRQQMAAGQDNASALWQELRAQHGYTGGRSLVTTWVARHRHLVPVSAEGRVPVRRGRPPETERARATSKPRTRSARQAAWLLVRRRAELSDEDEQFLERLCRTSTDIGVVYVLAQEFTQLVRERQAEALQVWLNAAAASDIDELQSFVAGIERDKAAVVAGLMLAWSNGQVEGQVNRLKLIKRSMYGRANFDLLRQRVLAA